MLRVLNIVMLVVLVTCVAVQYNDPDGWLWMLIYLYGTVVTAMAIVGKYTPLALLGVAGYLAGFVYLMPEWSFDSVMLLTKPKMETLAVEEAREAFGCLISAVWMSVLGWQWRVRTRAQE